MGNENGHENGQENGHENTQPEHQGPMPQQEDCLPSPSQIPETPLEELVDETLDEDALSLDDLARFSSCITLRLTFLPAPPTWNR